MRSPKITDLRVCRTGVGVPSKGPEKDGTCGAVGQALGRHPFDRRAVAGRATVFPYHRETGQGRRRGNVAVITDYDRQGRMY